MSTAVGILGFLSVQGDRFWASAAHFLSYPSVCLDATAFFELRFAKYVSGSNLLLFYSTLNLVICRRFLSANTSEETTAAFTGDLITASGLLLPR
jgi:hypothetical protein